MNQRFNTDDKPEVSCMVLEVEDGQGEVKGQRPGFILLRLEWQASHRASSTPSNWLTNAAVLSVSSNSQP